MLNIQNVQIQGSHFNTDSHGSGSETLTFIIKKLCFSGRFSKPGMSTRGRLLCPVTFSQLMRLTTLWRLQCPSCKYLLTGKVIFMIFTVILTIGTFSLGGVIKSVGDPYILYTDPDPALWLYRYGSGSWSRRVPIIWIQLDPDRTAGCYKA